MATSDSPLNVPNVTLAVARAESAPEPTDAPSISSVTDNGDGTLSISGSNFGVKAQAAPVLWCFGSDVRNNGTPVSYPAINDGDPVETTGPSEVWTSVDSRVLHSSDVRYPELGHSYFSSFNGTCRGPVAFGGGSPPYSDEIYVSFRVKNVAMWHGFKSCGFTNRSGTFDLGPSRFELGETVTIQKVGGETTTATIVCFNDEEDVVTLSGGSYVSSDLSGGVTMTGDTSGASLLLDSSLHYSYNTSGSKYLRMWSGGKPGQYHTYATSRLISGYRDDSSNSIADFKNENGTDDNGYGVEEFGVDAGWQMYEGYMSQRGLEHYQYMDIDNVDRRYGYFSAITEEQKYTDRSPTISQIGIDAVGGGDQTGVALHFGEIYFDKSPKRVILSDKATYTEVGQEQELQFPVSWSDTSITFEQRLGALSGASQIYVYVFNAEDGWNEQGYTI